MCPGEGLGCSVWCGGARGHGGAVGRMVSMAGIRPPALRSGWAGGGPELEGGDVPGGPGTRLGRCRSVWATDLARAEPVRAAASVGCPSVLGGWYSRPLRRAPDCGSAVPGHGGGRGVVSLFLSLSPFLGLGPLACPCGEDAAQPVRPSPR